LSLVEAGYDVWANTEASGTFSDKLAADANRRMEQAGVHLMGLFGMAMDLMRDWYFAPRHPTHKNINIDQMTGETPPVPRKFFHSLTSKF
jgi:hypothetical protein